MHTHAAQRGRTLEVLEQVGDRIALVVEQQWLVLATAAAAAAEVAHRGWQGVA